MVYIRSIFLLLLAALPGMAFANAVYRGAIVIDAADGHVLFEDQADYVGPPASVTKLMTFLVVHDALEAGELSLTTPITATATDESMGGTQVWLRAGEVFSVEELLYALMIRSANDAAHAFTHAVAGSREAFLARMNARSRALGLADTTWRSPHGLPPRSRALAESDITSPRDLATLARVVLAETDVLRYSSVERRTFGALQRAAPVEMVNSNQLLGSVRGVDGLKTGFTRGAGYCLVATATRDGRRIIGVIMGAPSGQQRDIKMAELLEIGFARLTAPIPTLNLSIAVPATSSAATGASPDTNNTPSAAEPPTVRFVIPD